MQTDSALNVRVARLEGEVTSTKKALRNQEKFTNTVLSLVKVNRATDQQMYEQLSSQMKLLSVDNAQLQTDLRRSESEYRRISNLLSNLLFTQCTAQNGVWNPSAHSEDIYERDSHASSLSVKIDVQSDIMMLSPGDQSEDLSLESIHAGDLARETQSSPIKVPPTSSQSIPMHATASTTLADRPTFAISNHSTIARSVPSRWQTNGPADVDDLFYLPNNPKSSWCTVLISNVPETPGIRDPLKLIVVPRHSLVSAKLLATARMRTVPPMEYDTVLLSFLTSEAATQYIHEYWPRSTKPENDDGDLAKGQPHATLLRTPSRPLPSLLTLPWPCTDPNSIANLSNTLYLRDRAYPRVSFSLQHVIAQASSIAACLGVVFTDAYTATGTYRLTFADVMCARKMYNALYCRFFRSPDGDAHPHGNSANLDLGFVAVSELVWEASQHGDWRSEISSAPPLIEFD